MSSVGQEKRHFAELLQQWASFNPDDGLNDIKDYAQLFRLLAKQCDHITEFGVRNGISTAAFLSGMPKKYVGYDIIRRPNIDMLESMAKLLNVGFEFREKDTTTAQIDETDLLFVDACHRYSHVSKELRNAPRVRKFIVFHDTVQCWQWEEGNPVKTEGIGRAIQELLTKGEWFVSSNYTKGSGLMVLARV